jgi:hypothetical protein
MKAFNESWRKRFDRLASSFSLTEKSAEGICVSSNPDEHNQADILTSDVSSLPPSRPRWGDQWL